jgi:hypothetical protein
MPLHRDAPLNRKPKFLAPIISGPDSGLARAGRKAKTFQHRYGFGLLGDSMAFI